jgi:arylsulfatase A
MNGLHASTASRRLSRGRWLLLALVAGLAAATTSGARAADADRPDRPNIVVIMADDLGFGDISANGARALTTPAIDRLASEGIRFTSGYASASTCTPTRYSFLTGTYALRRKGTGVAPPNGPALIAPGTETLPAILKRAGYATAVVGKWHLGLGTPAPEWNGELRPGPLEIGFDRCLLLPTTNDRVPQVLVENDRVRNLDPADPLWVGDEPPSPDHPTGISHRHTLKLDWSHGHNQTIHNGIGRIGYYTGGAAARFRDEDLADTWAREARSWIAANRERPFFLFLASQDIHVPRVAHERFQGSSLLGPRGDCILQFDWLVGEVMAALEEQGLTRNTLVVLCSDNGPVLDDGYRDRALEKLGDHRPAGPFSGGKYSVLEGGTRTPFITRWPGRIAPGVSDALVSTIDLAASLAALVNEPIRDHGCLDSMNVLDALLGRSPAGRDHVLQQNNEGSNLGLRIGPWKLVRILNRTRGQAVVTVEPAVLPAGEYGLFRLDQDPAELVDLSATHPDQLQQMTQRLEQILRAGRTRAAAPSS